MIITLAMLTLATPIQQRRMPEEPASAGRQYGSYRESRAFGDCIVRGSVAEARRLLDQATAPEGTEPVSAGRYVNQHRGCARSSARTNPLMLRAGLAEAVLAASPDKAKVPAATSSAQVMTFLKAVRVPQDATPDRKVAQLAAECRVASAPQLVRPVIASELGSPAQDAALAALMAAQPKCGGLEDPKTLGPAETRAYLAEALYHWSFAGPTAKSN